jgi:hypothetical protein
MSSPQENDRERASREHRQPNHPAVGWIFSGKRRERELGFGRAGPASGPRWKRLIPSDPPSAYGVREAKIPVKNSPAKSRAISSVSNILIGML